MPRPNRAVSPGISSLIPVELQEYIWAIHEQNPLLPSIFELRKGKGRYTQLINHLCLLPYYDKRHTVKLAEPLHDIRVTILSIESGKLLMRLSNKKLEKSIAEGNGEIRQGELF